MKVIGSVIARLGSKRLPYKNILPFEGVPLVVLGIQKLKACHSVNDIIVSTESELIARIAAGHGAHILRRPAELAQDDTPSIPVFQHIMEHFEGNVHVNYNINFPLCDPAVIDRAVELAVENGESLSVPYAVWAQTATCLKDYKDPMTITAYKFDDDRAGSTDIHTEEELLEVYRTAQGPLPEWDSTI
tara:strand:- start:36921 stop:37484 length:564 start_codon:yes stop_codon:yes gene_type:complete